jgi:uncharacterized protein (TIGR00661 family)
MIPAIRKRAQVDVLVSGMHSEIDLGQPIRFRAKGLGFKFGKHGGVDLVNTWWHGDVPRFFREIEQLDLSEYDMVINDFEPVSAWAARKQQVPCVGLSNQCTLLDPRIAAPPQSNISAVGKAILKHYAPIDVAYGLHYHTLEPFIHTPIIRREIRNLEPSHGSHYLVYLPSFADDKIIRSLRQFPNVRWVVFSKHTRKAYREGAIDVMPVNGESYLQSMASCKGVLCAAGFGITTEALFLGKKLMVLPMKNQYEQACNTYTLEAYGIPSIKSLKPKWHPHIAQWLTSHHSVELQYPDHTQQMVDQIIGDFAKQKAMLDEVIESRLG